MTVGPLGRVHLDKHSSVPGMAAGDVVRVCTFAGRLVADGGLHRDSD